MRILFLEADFIGIHDEIFISHLESNGHTVTKLEQCYKNIPKIVEAIQDGIHVIAFRTTFVQNKKEYGQLWNLCAFLDIDRGYPLELWCIAYDSAHTVKYHVPVKYQPFIKVYDCDDAAYVRGETNDFLTLMEYPS